MPNTRCTWTINKHMNLDYSVSMNSIWKALSITRSNSISLMWMFMTSAVGWACAYQGQV